MSGILCWVSGHAAAGDAPVLSASMATGGGEASPSPGASLQPPQ